MNAIKTNMSPFMAPQQLQRADGGKRPFGAHMGTQPPQVPLRFGNNGLFNAFTEFDFIDVGKSTIRHNQVIYGICILSRVLAASTRSWNEVREHLLRDVFGWTFWFYATPMILRGFLKALAPKDVQDITVQKLPKPEGKGILATLKKINWTLNPLARWNIASTEQIKERTTQMLDQVAEKAGGKESELYKKAEQAVVKLMERSKIWRNGASGFSIVLAIALLGISIPMFNIMMTKRNVKAGHVGNQ